MPPSPRGPNSGNIFEELGIPEPEFELAKADLAIRIQRLAEHRRLTRDEAAALLNVPAFELAALFEGKLATCSLDQLLRMLTCLGDDVEITIRPRLQRTKRGALRVLQAAAVERPEDFEPVRLGRRQRLSTQGSDGSHVKTEAGIQSTSTRTRDDRELLNKHVVEKMTSLDITTIYRKMAAGKFPQPVRVGRRRVAWRTSDIVRWQQDLEVGTEAVRRKKGGSREGNPEGGGRGKSGRG
jgi:predicted DNA-binding transcriptional regulator AlpA/predicted XRE-type DNA-binding protein